MDACEQAIQLAISDLNTVIYTSQRAAAKAYGIAPSTLRGQINGATN